MVSIYSQDDRGKMSIFEFRGLSTDPKPTEKIDNEIIGNGSVFIEMDTQKILFYDSDTNDWVGVEE